MKPSAKISFENPTRVTKFCYLQLLYSQFLQQMATFYRISFILLYSATAADCVCSSEKYLIIAQSHTSTDLFSCHTHYSSLIHNCLNLTMKISKYLSTANQTITSRTNELLRMKSAMAETVHLNAILKSNKNVVYEMMALATYTQMSART